MTRILGIDPGIRGGLAIVEISDGAAPRLIDAIDIPTVGTGAKERVFPGTVSACRRGGRSSAMAASETDKLREKLWKLIALLGSNNAGEREAARALGRPRRD